MRITKSRLMEIIMEEISLALNEAQSTQAYPGALPADVTDPGELGADYDAEIELANANVQKASQGPQKVAAQQRLNMLVKQQNKLATKHMV